MSCWSEIRFLATGDVDRSKELEKELPSLVQVVSEAERVAGMLSACVAQNYGGADSMTHVVERYPDLYFTGMQHHDAAGDRFWVFNGLNGQAEWGEHSFPDFDRSWTATELQDEIARINEKIARLSSDRDSYERQLREIENPSEPTAPIVTRDERAVRAILARLKANGTPANTPSDRASEPSAPPESESLTGQLVERDDFI